MIFMQTVVQVTHDFIDLKKHLVFWPIITFSDIPVIYDPYDCIKGIFNFHYKPPWIMDSRFIQNAK